MWVDILYESLKIRLMFLILIFFSQTLRAMLMSRNSFKIGSKFKKNKIYIYIVKVSFGLAGEFEGFM